MEIVDLSKLLFCELFIGLTPRPTAPAALTLPPEASLAALRE
jgi:hypothetical protein